MRSQTLLTVCSSSVYWQNLPPYRPKQSSFSLQGGTTRPTVQLCLSKGTSSPMVHSHSGQKHTASMDHYHVWIMLHQNMWETVFLHSWASVRYLAFTVRGLTLNRPHSQKKKKQKFLNLNVSSIFQGILINEASLHGGGNRRSSKNYTHCVCLDLYRMLVLLAIEPVKSSFSVQRQYEFSYSLFMASVLWVKGILTG